MLIALGITAINKHLKNIFSMQDFAQSINKFLVFNEYKILEGSRKISINQADKKAIYDEYNTIDKQSKKLTKSE